MGSSSPDPDREAHPILFLRKDDIRKVINPALSIEVTERALRSTSDGTARQDIRRTLPLPGGDENCLSLMYAALADQPLFGAKVLSVFPGNFSNGIASHQGLVALFERERGEPVALMDGGELTAWRTAAASAVATRELSRPDASVLAVFGYGEQAQRHVTAISLVRDISSIRIWGRDSAKAERFAAIQREAGFRAEAFGDPQTALQGADIICTTTSAEEPVLRGPWLHEGVHVNAVGASVAAIKEIDAECIRRASVWVDYMPMGLTSAGEIVEALQTGMITPADIRGEVGEVLTGKVPGRRGASEITLYRSLGVPAQDIQLANFVYSQARILGLGSELSF